MLAQHRPHTAHLLPGRQLTAQGSARAACGRVLLLIMVEGDLVRTGLMTQAGLASVLRSSSTAVAQEVLSRAQVFLRRLRREITVVVVVVAPRCLQL